MKYRTLILFLPNIQTAAVICVMMLCRYSGRTQKELVEYVRENYIKREPFERQVLNISSTSLASLNIEASPHIDAVLKMFSCLFNEAGNIFCEFFLPN